MRRIRTIVTLLFVALALLLSAIDVSTYFGFAEAHKNIVNGQLTMVSQAIRLRTEALLSEGGQLLKALSATIDLDSRELEEFSPLLRRVHKKYERYTNFSLVNPEGYIVASSTPMNGPVDVSDEPNIRSAIDEKRLAFSSFVIGPITERPTIVASLPLLDEAGEVEAVINNGLSLDWFVGFIEALSTNREQTTLLVDDRGTLLARYPGRTGEIGSSVANHPVVSAVIADRRESGNAEIDGEELLFGSASSSEVPGGLHVISYLDSSAALARIREPGRLLLLLHILAVAGALGFAGWVAHTLLVDPLLHLTEHARQVSTGDFATRIPPTKSVAEIGMVIDTFNRMTESLREHEEAQREAQHELEGRVRERTEELEEALAAKTSLMEELNHRVKNNLSMVSSFISLKQDALGGTVDLSDIRSHVQAISAVHDKLYQSGSLNEIDFGSYVEDLLRSVFSFYSGPEVTIENEISGVRLPTKTVTSLGLIVNELATNAMKYGFRPEEEAPRFSLAFETEHDRGDHVLTISNNGNPFPEEIDLQNADTLGLQLISVLVAQLGGTVELERHPTPTFTIRFPAE
ncbi:MAG: sensor histidine kinase [Spirochaetaceae bacterium]